MTEAGEGLVIVGLGNPILSNDGVGVHAAISLASVFPGAEVTTIPMIGMDLLDRMIGHDTLVIVDAVATGSSPIGTVTHFQLPGQGLHVTSSHGPDLQLLLSLGHSLGLQLPRAILVYGIEIGTEVPYGETLTPALQERLETALQDIAADIHCHLGPS